MNFTQVGILLSAVMFSASCGARSGLPGAEPDGEGVEVGGDGETFLPDVGTDEVAAARDALDAPKDVDWSEDVSFEDAAATELVACKLPASAFDHASTFGSLTYDTSCSGDGACKERLTMTRDCSLTRVDPTRAVHYARLSDSDCAVMQRWLTSDVLTKALYADSSAYRSCRLATQPGRFEETQIGWAAFAEGRTDFCEVEPFVQHRRCLQALVAAYVP